MISHASNSSSHKLSFPFAFWLWYQSLGDLQDRHMERPYFSFSVFPACFLSLDLFLVFSQFSVLLGYRYIQIIIVWFLLSSPCAGPVGGKSFSHTSYYCPKDPFLWEWIPSFENLFSHHLWHKTTLFASSFITLICFAQSLGFLFLFQWYCISNR